MFYVGYGIKKVRASSYNNIHDTLFLNALQKQLLNKKNINNKNACKWTSVSTKYQLLLDYKHMLLKGAAQVQNPVLILLTLASRFNTTRKLG
ncbi:hypothetical protein ABH17_028700 (plasmid) [Bacillus toyonensis]|nr:hypothetical protein ABH17_028700 [Bacillus toyonensis]